MGYVERRLAGSLPRLQHALLFFQLWLGADYKSYYEGFSIRRHGGTDVPGMWFMPNVKQKSDGACSRSGLGSGKLGLPIAMGHARTKALCLLHLCAAGFRTLCCGTLASTSVLLLLFVM